MGSLYPNNERKTVPMLVSLQIKGLKKRTEERRKSIVLSDRIVVFFIKTVVGLLWFIHIFLSSIQSDVKIGFGSVVPDGI